MFYSTLQYAKSGRKFGHFSGTFLVISFRFLLGPILSLFIQLLHEFVNCEWFFRSPVNVHVAILLQELAVGLKEDENLVSVL
jgi:hypothetical protein